MKHEGYNEIRQRGHFDFPFEFHHVDFYHPRFNMLYHWHIEYEIIYLLEGSFLISLNEQEISMSAGDIVFIRDGIVHGGLPSTGRCVYECIVFDMQKFLRNNCIQHDKIEDILNHTLRISNHFDAKQPEILQIVQDLFKAMRERRDGYEFTAAGQLYTFLGAVLRQKFYHTANNYALAVSRHHIYQVKQAFRLIDTSYASALTLDDLSRAAGLSPNYFCRFFQKMTHRTPIDYLNYYRIETACIKLASSDLLITEIAYACGFNDLSYFIKIFKKYKGFSPRRYQKSVNLRSTAAVQ